MAFVIVQSTGSFLELVDVVVEKFGDQVDVSQDHSSAAVPAETELVKGECLDAFDRLVFLVVLSGLLLLELLDQVDEPVVLVSNHLSAGKASNWDYHVFLFF